MDLPSEVCFCLLVDTDSNSSAGQLKEKKIKKLPFSYVINSVIAKWNIYQEIARVQSKKVSEMHRK